MTRPPLSAIITKGAVDKGGRCPDGTITVARAGNDLALFWFGSIEANTIVVYGTLFKKVEPGTRWHRGTSQGHVPDAVLSGGLQWLW
jgi:hypothetical protein